MKKVLTLAALMLAVSACTGQQAEPQAKPVNVASLAGDSQITDVRPADAMPTYPKRGMSIERNYIEQPPLIPHRDDYTIGLNQNKCMTCHSWDKAEKMKATPVAKSHVVNAQGKLNGQNYFCTQCHVAQADNKQAIVENVFSTK
ncbi:nitrate reductase cytochrome c-type subunit [Shewanella gelidii]|uniref:Periplasmic nitrate reductase, electron transfer subunit n=1 Tax=Shewanella gelidii TaxID=1642821 RepID=A0A917JRJ3_9GAMM|nr:nitrate reductase cytochrome c-type subunit [Shewanella gelidii]MCL1097864.1 nitrate reductase cytochrome c-type subunit [Shewanella gelidii]GGI78164.1 periplasmic nitrate reductase, electron transfer subunit [Shewanella gelidii]